jgi:hypothetical protein
MAGGGAGAMPHGLHKINIICTFIETFKIKKTVLYLYYIYLHMLYIFILINNDKEEEEKKKKNDHT